MSLSIGDHSDSHNWQTNLTGGAVSYCEQGGRNRTERCSKWVKVGIILSVLAVFVLITLTAFSLSTMIGALFTGLSALCFFVVLVTPWLCRCCTRLTSRSDTCSQSECNTAFEMQSSGQSQSRKNTEKYYMPVTTHQPAPTGPESAENSNPSTNSKQAY